MEVTQTRIDERIEYVQRALAAPEVPDVRIKAASNLAFCWLSDVQAASDLATHRDTMASLVDRIVDRQLFNSYSHLEPAYVKAYPDEQARCQRARTTLARALLSRPISTRESLIDSIDELVALRNQAMAINLIAKNGLKLGVDTSTAKLLRSVLQDMEPFEAHRREIRRVVLSHITLCVEQKARPLAWELTLLALNTGIFSQYNHLPREGLEAVIESELRNRAPLETLRLMEQLGKAGWADPKLWRLTLNRFGQQGCKDQLVALTAANGRIAGDDLAEAAYRWACTWLQSHSISNSRKLLEHPSVDYTLPRNYKYRRRFADLLTVEDPNMRHCALWTRLWEIDIATPDHENLVLLTQYAELFHKIRNSGNKDTAIRLALGTLYDSSRLTPEGKPEQFADWCVLHQATMHQLRTPLHIDALVAHFNPKLIQRDELREAASQYFGELAARLRDHNDKMRVRRLIGDAGL